MPSKPLPFEARAISELYLIWDIKVRQHDAPILFFFGKTTYRHLLKTYPQQFCNMYFRGSLTEALAAVFGHP